ncbi:MAG: LytR C-terminal domain-containing protein [Actinobacteria bacterium]|nr:LytR C-terminal domain-containing protein [Actinomycetota bacterium]
MLCALVVVAYWGVGRIAAEDSWLSFRKSGEAAGTSSTAPLPVHVVLLEVLQDEKVAVLVLLAPERTPTMVVGLPGQTLVRAPSGFEPLDSLLAAGGAGGALSDEAAAGVEAVLGVRPTVRASTEWAQLIEAVAAAGLTLPGVDVLPSDDGDVAAVVASAVASLAGASATAKGSDALDKLVLTGEAGAFRVTVRALSAGAQVIAGIPGRPVEGTGFAYYEPDMTAIQTLLGGEPRESDITVEVQNGSGVVGAAQKVSDAIAPLGYTLLPPRNADGFPDVEQTQIFTAGDAAAEADHLRGALGKGTVVKQGSLPSGRIVVIVGKDLDVNDLPGTGGR